MSGLEFASRAYMLRLVTASGERRICVDAGLAGLLTIEFRILTLIYPEGVCVGEPRGLPVLESGVGAEELHERLCRACEEALEAHLSWRRGRGLLRRLFSPPSPEELLSGEAYHALMVCREVGIPDSRLLEGRPAYVVYVEGSPGWRRLRSLARIEEGLLERLEALLRRG